MDENYSSDKKLLSWQRQSEKAKDFSMMEKFTEWRPKDFSIMKILY